MFKATQVVQGLKRSKGEYEGRQYDSTKVFVSVDLRDDNGVGTATNPFDWGDSTNYERVRAQDFHFPALCELTYEMVTTGSVPRMILVEFKYLKPADSSVDTKQKAAA